MQNQTLLLATGAVALLLLLLILMSIARRNARREAELTDSYQAPAAGQKQAVAESEADDFNVALADTHNNEQDGEQIDDEATLDVASDPLTQTEQLIAREQLNEAADLLEDAIDQEPERVDLRLKMMEIEARLENQQGYAIQVEALNRMGVAGPSVDLMNARYPLMAAGLVAGVELLDADAQAEQGDIQELEEITLGQPELDDAGDFDFADFGLEEESAASLADTDEQEIGFDLDFDLDEVLPSVDVTEPAAELPVEEPIEEPVVEQPQFEPLPATEDDLELELDADLQVENLLAEFEAMGASDEDVLQADSVTADDAEDTGFSLSDDDLADFEAQLQAEMQVESATDEAAQEAVQADDSDLFDTLDSTSEKLMTDELDDDFDFLSDTDESATKLDLARAYIDMGDEEGARDILAEVVDEGNEQQQQDAREMMEQLG